MKDLEHNIQELIESKNYETLTPEEVQMIGNLYTEEEYRDMRDTVLQFQEAFATAATIVPQAKSIAILNSKLEETGQEDNAPSLFMRIFAYRIPLYQPVAASLLLLMGYFIFSNNTKPDIASNPSPKTKDVVTTRTVRDTVYISKPEIITQIKNVYVQAEPTKESKPSNTQFVEDGQQFIPKVSIPSTDEIVSSYGNTSINEDLTEQFKVRM
ncbi:MAG: hypothetical protein ACJAR8_000204 [Bacteroidia bacterium]|jgi:hypothetical protein